MEKVWYELKKIEAQAEQIRSEAQDGAKEMIALALQKAKKLIANGNACGEEEAHQLYTSTIQEINRNREEQLKAKSRSQSEPEGPSGKTVGTSGLYSCEHSAWGN